MDSCDQEIAEVTDLRRIMFLNPELKNVITDAIRIGENAGRDSMHSFS